MWNFLPPSVEKEGTEMELIIDYACVKKPPQILHVKGLGGLAPVDFQEGGVPGAGTELCPPHPALGTPRHTLYNDPLRISEL